MYVADLTDQLTISSILDVAYTWVGKAFMLSAIKTVPCHCEECFLRRGNPYLVINESFNKSVIASAFCEAIHKLLTHPVKIFIGRIKTEFNFLRFNLSLEKLKLSKTTIENHQAKVVQLLELRATTQRLEQHWQNWSRWAMGSLHNYRSRLLTNQDPASQQRYARDAFGIILIVNTLPLRHRTVTIKITQNIFVINGDTKCQFYLSTATRQTISK